MINAAQCRAGRGLLSWSQLDLSSAANVGIVTVRNFEAGNAVPRRATLDVIQRAFEAAGVEFIAENGGGAGVRLKKAIAGVGRAPAIPVDELTSENDD